MLHCVATLHCGASTEVQEPRRVSTGYRPHPLQAAGDGPERGPQLLPLAAQQAKHPGPPPAGGHLRLLPGQQPARQLEGDLGGGSCIHRGAKRLD
jgi:hypothetical protein